MPHYTRDVIASGSLEARIMPPLDPLEPNRCAKLLAALAAPERLRIVRELATAPRNVTAVAAMLGVPSANASHHLRVLEQSGIVAAHRQGRYVWYSLRDGVGTRIASAGIAADALDLGCCQIVMPAGKPARTPRRTVSAAPPPRHRRHDV